MEINFQLAKTVDIKSTNKNLNNFLAIQLFLHEIDRNSKIVLFTNNFFFFYFTHSEENSL